jgi:ArsR family transcriptional regulator, arsenate/arsenite/antimonite-responsive transcriptional repressor
MIDMEQFVKQLKSLGDASRMKIIRLLCEANDDLCVCEIMDAIEDSHSNISRHLKILRAAGLVNEKKEGRWAYFSLADSDSAFHKNLLQTIRSIPGKYIADDSERLKLRLSLREDGKCIDGLKSEKWTAAMKFIRTEKVTRYRNKQERIGR